MKRTRSARPLTTAAVVALAGGAFRPVEDGRDAAGNPVKRFRKEVVRVGEYVKAGQRISITPELLAQFARETNRFIANGGKVPAPGGANPHENADDADANRGWWTDFEVEGDSLLATVSLVGDDAIALAGRTDVSIYAVPEFTDGAGNTYQWPILHVALTPEPVVQGLGEFVPVAASRGGSPVKVPVYRLAMDAQPMDILKQIAAALGLNADEFADEAALVEAIIAKAKSMAGETAAAQETVAATRRELDALKASRGKPVEVDPDLLEEQADSVADALASLRDTGRILPAVHDKLALALLGEPGKRPALCLSRKAATAAGFPSPLARIVIDALRENDPVKLGEQTKLNAAALSRTVPGAAPDDGEWVDESIRTHNARHANAAI